MNNYAGKPDKYPELNVYKLFGGENGIKIISNLMCNSMGFNELMRSTEIPSAKTLSNTLKRLIAKDVVKKEIKTINPPSAAYSLTDRGKVVGSILATMKELGRTVNESGTH